jgi:hypothetical protein
MSPLATMATKKRPCEKAKDIDSVGARYRFLDTQLGKLSFYH